MTKEELLKIVRKEEEERQEELVHCLFSPTEHCQDAGISGALHRLEMLILKGYLKPSDLLLMIGRVTERELAKTNKYYRY